MKNIKIIALDLDDTLLREDLSISDFTVSVLQEAAQKGIYSVLASGRIENAIYPFAQRINLTHCEYGRYFVAQNGGTIFDTLLQKQIYSKNLDATILRFIYKKALEQGLYVQVYEDSSIYVPKENPWTEWDTKLSGLEMCVVADYEAFLGKTFPKMVIPGDPQVLQGFQKELQNAIGSVTEIFISKPYFLEVMPKNCGKGQALLILSQLLGIDKDNVLIFGDSMNDESMFDCFSHTVAMKNGLDYIKNKAKYITDYSHNEDGVAHFLKKYVL